MSSRFHPDAAMEDGGVLGALGSGQSEGPASLSKGGLKFSKDMPGPVDAMAPRRQQVRFGRGSQECWVPV